MDLRTPSGGAGAGAKARGPVPLRTSGCCRAQQFLNWPQATTVWPTVFDARNGPLRPNATSTKGRRVIISGVAWKDTATDGRIKVGHHIARLDVVTEDLNLTKRFDIPANHRSGRRYRIVDSSFQRSEGSSICSKLAYHPHCQVASGRGALRGNYHRKDANLGR
jgi:hypothetical protein